MTDVAVPQLIGLTVPRARDACHQAGALVPISKNPDGPALGALAGPGTWIVTAQAPAAGTLSSRGDTVVLEFEEQRGGSTSERSPV